MTAGDVNAIGAVLLAGVVVVEVVKTARTWRRHRTLTRQALEDHAD